MRRTIYIICDTYARIIIIIPTRFARYHTLFITVIVTSGNVDKQVCNALAALYAHFIFRVYIYTYNIPIIIITILFRN